MNNWVVYLLSRLSLSKQPLLTISVLMQKSNISEVPVQHVNFYTCALIWMHLKVITELTQQTC